jgi:hypothetical protein
MRRRFQRRKTLRGLKDAVFRGVGISLVIFFSPHVAKTPAGRQRYDSRREMKHPALANLLRLKADRGGCMFPVGLKSQRTF